MVTYLAGQNAKDGQLGALSLVTVCVLAAEGRRVGHISVLLFKGRLCLSWGLATLWGCMSCMSGVVLSTR